MNSVRDDVRDYERWLRSQCAVIESGLKAKHGRMRESAFEFLRATYFRWARTIESVCEDLVDAPRVACVGDTHVENFGTWRDADGRLVWGVNDFDEAAPMPYAYDLVRLAASATLAPDLVIRPADAARAILRGYAKGLANPQPTLLDQGAHWLRPFADGGARANRKFWREVTEWPDAKPPSIVRHALRRSLPVGADSISFASRQSGGGSLGRPRFVAIAQWRSGTVVREAKALVPSAWLWAHGKKRKRSRFEELACGTHRAPDASLRLNGAWIVRRLAPDSQKLNLEDIASSGLTVDLLSHMAADIGAIHAADSRANRILEDLASRKSGWLRTAATAACELTLRDYDSYR